MEDGNVFENLLLLVIAEYLINQINKAQVAVVEVSCHCNSGFGVSVIMAHEPRIDGGASPDKVR